MPVPKKRIIKPVHKMFFACGVLAALILLVSASAQADELSQANPDVVEVNAVEATEVVGGDVSADSVEGALGNDASFFVVRQCWKPGTLLESENVPWDRNTARPVNDWPSFSGFTLSGKGTTGDSVSQPNKKGLKAVGQFGQKNSGDTADESIQELDCERYGDRYWMGAEWDPGNWTTGWQPDGWNSVDKESWKKWVYDRGLSYMSDQEFADNFLHENFWMRQNIRTAIGASAFQLQGKWRACTRQRVIPQFWAQSRIAGNQKDSPMEYLDVMGEYSYNTTLTWAPDNACHPTNDSVFNIEWSPEVSAYECPYPKNSVRYQECIRKFLRDDIENPSQENPTVIDGGSVGGKTHIGLTQQAAVFRTSSVCSGLGAPNPRPANCFEKAADTRKVKRCERLVWKNPAKPSDGRKTAYSFRYINDNCPDGVGPEPNSNTDWSWSDGNGGIVDPGGAGDPPHVKVPGFRHDQSGGQRTMFGNGVLPMVDRRPPEIINGNTEYFDMKTDRLFPAIAGMPYSGYPYNSSYHIALSDKNPRMRFHVGDSGGGVYRANLTRRDLLPYQNSNPPQMLSGPRMAFEYPAYVPEKPQAVVASPGAWDEADVFEYQWQRCSISSSPVTPQCTNRGGPTQSNWFLPNAEDAQGRIRVLVRAGKNIGTFLEPDYVWSSFVSSEISEQFLKPSSWLDWSESRKSAIFGTPRVGQTVGIFVREPFDILWSCSSQASTPSDCDSRPIQIYQHAGSYRIQPEDAGRWLVMGSPTELAVQDVKLRNNDQDTQVFRGFFPGTVGGGGLISDFAMARSGIAVDGRTDQPLASEYGVLPPYSQRQDLCDNGPAAGIVARPSLVGEKVPWEYATSTRPCPAEKQFTWDLDDFDSAYAPSSRLWAEGLNFVDLSVQDFCTRDSVGYCAAQVDQKPLRGIVVDTADPSWSRTVSCKRPDGENGWHVSEPYCRFQVLDRYKKCATDFDYYEGAPISSLRCPSQKWRDQSALLESVSWRETANKASGNLAETAARDGVSYWMEGLPDGRPAVETEARDRADNASDRDYEDFVKIDTQPPMPLLISEGPAEIEPDGYESLRYREDGSLERVEPGAPRSFEIPQSPDETNDSVPSVAEDLDRVEDCALCWRVEGLEEADGTPGTFDYDHEGRMQCQLVYGGSGRSPEGEAAAWVDPAWPLDMSATTKAGNAAEKGQVVSGLGSSLYAPVVADSTDWNCAPQGHDGDEVVVAPFSMAGRPDGHYLLRVRQKDRAGLTSSWTGRPFIYDTTAPEPGVIVSTSAQEASAGQSATRQWLFSWGWDLLARGGNAGSYCFVAEAASKQTVRRSGWGCGPTASPDERPQNTRPLDFRKILPGQKALQAQAQGLSNPEPLETPMPFPGVRGEGRGTLAGLPDGSYFLGVLQRDKLGQINTFEKVCEDDERVSIGEDPLQGFSCIGFSKDTDSVGPVPEPDVDLQSFLPKESVTSRRTEAELRIEAANPLNTGQAFFPMDGWITHATPQELYSYCQSMDENYSEYWPENLAWEQKEQQIGSGPPVGVTCPTEIDSDQRQTAIRHEGTLSLNGSDGLAVDPASPTAYGNFIMNIFWLRPTLEDENRPAAESAYRGGP